MNLSASIGLAGSKSRGMLLLAADFNNNNNRLFASNPIENTINMLCNFTLKNRIQEATQDVYGMYKVLKSCKDFYTCRERKLSPAYTTKHLPSALIKS